MSARGFPGSLILCLLTTPALGAEVTILHTNDWQSGLTGVGPDAAYTSSITGDDQTRGGVARLAALIDARRAARKPAGPVLLLDGGDVTMGTLYHTVTRETGSELQLMARLGYDAVTLGNHEFDFGENGLGQMIASATTGVGVPPLVATNLDMTRDHPDLAPLKRLYERGLLHRTRLVDRGGVKVGFIGILGVDAQEVMATERVGITPLAESAAAAAAELRAQGADLVVVMSHSGVRRHADGSWGGEEVELMRAVPSIDVIVGGHSHTVLEAPILVDGRPVIQAGSDTMWLGELHLVRDGERWATSQYKLHSIDDTIRGREDITAEIAAIKEVVNETVLAPLGYHFDQVVGEAHRAHGRGFDEHVVGNLVTDSMRAATGADVAVTGNGTLRSNLYPGVQRVSDIFRIAGLGSGLTDDADGYPLVKLYLNGPSLKDVLEFLLVGYALKGAKYYPRISGVKVYYNPYRVPFDRVIRVEMGDEARGYHELDLTDRSLRISLAMSSYVATFLPIISELSFGILDPTLLDENDEPVAVGQLASALVDGDPKTEGVQELKEWRALIDYVASRPDTDDDGLPNIPETGAAAAPRLVAQASLTPRAMLGNATWRMWTAFGVVLGGGLTGVLLVRSWVQRRRR